MAEEEKVRERFNAWCPIKIVDGGKAPRAVELVAAYWTAWQAAYALGREDGIEQADARHLLAVEMAVKESTGPTGGWLVSPKQFLLAIQVAIRSLSRKSDVQNKREG